MRHPLKDPSIVICWAIYVELKKPKLFLPSSYLYHSHSSDKAGYSPRFTTDIIKQRRVMLFPWLNFCCCIKWILFNCMVWLEDTPSRIVIITTWIYTQICSAGNKSFGGLCNAILCVCVCYMLHKNRKNSQILRHWYKSLLKHCCHFSLSHPLLYNWRACHAWIEFGKSNSLLHEGESLKAL